MHCFKIVHTRSNDYDEINSGPIQCGQMELAEYEPEHKQNLNILLHLFQVTTPFVDYCILQQVRSST